MARAVPANAASPLRRKVKLIINDPTPLSGGERKALAMALPAFPISDEFGPVVAGEDDDGVLTDAQPIDGVEHLADVVIHLGQQVGPVSVAGLAGEGRVRQRRRCGCVMAA